MLNGWLREEALSDFCAELLDCLVVTWESTHWSDAVLMYKLQLKSRELSKRDYLDKDKCSKSVSKFLLKFSELQPKQMLKNMSHLSVLFDVESSAIRCSMVEVIANVIHFHLANDDSPTAAKNLKSFYDIIIQRFHDVSPFVRTRVLKVLGTLTQ